MGASTKLVPQTIEEQLSELLIGQPESIKTIAPFLQMHAAGFQPEGRPIGVVMLLGPTGTGKTRTVEALAEVLHGSAKQLLRIDCGEFQSDHEVAKLIGSPPGYLGHKETQPLLTQYKVNLCASYRSDISLVLFDEIEKAAPSFTRILLGILDKATLTLGTNDKVNFENALIFMTSNLGSSEMRRMIRPDFGYEAFSQMEPSWDKLQAVSMSAVKRKFSPEFINRVDAFITYQPLDRDACNVILTHILNDFTELVQSRLGGNRMSISCSHEARSLLLKLGVSAEFGARELKRTVHRHLFQPLACMVSKGKVPYGSTVILEASQGEFSLVVLGK